MLNRSLEKRIELSNNEDLQGRKNSIELEYYLLESTLSDSEELTGKKAYGIEIVKKVSDTDIESKMVKNLLCCRESTRKILDKLADNTVTPVGLPFILDDMIGI